MLRHPEDDVIACPIIFLYSDARALDADKDRMPDLLTTLFNVPVALRQPRCS